MATAFLRNKDEAKEGACPDYRPILLQSALLHKNTGAISPVVGIAPVFSYRPIASKVSRVSFNAVISLAAAL